MKKRFLFLIPLIAGCSVASAQSPDVLTAVRDICEDHNSDILPMAGRLVIIGQEMVESGNSLADYVGEPRPYSPFQLRELRTKAESLQSYLETLNTEIDYLCSFNYREAED